MTRSGGPTNGWPAESPPLWLRAAEKVYRTFLHVHDFLYARGILRAADAGVPVVSVGNLTVGGTGKTPCVIWLATELRRRGHRPVILTRGYGRRGIRLTVLEPGAPSAGALASSRETGDEPLEMFEALRLPVVIGRDRVRAARLAVARFRPTCLLLDDAFQHRPIRRDFDLVLLDAASPYGNFHLLPAGPLRDLPGAEARADAFLLTRANEVDDLSAADLCREWLRGNAAHAWVGLADHVPVGLAPVGSGAITPAPPAAGTPVLAVAGIARPASLGKAAEALGFPVEARLDFPDHHRYTPADLARVVQAAAGRPIVTTAKDAVRWRAVPGFAGAGWWVVRVEFRPREAAGLLDRIEAALRGEARGGARRGVSGKG